MRNETESQKDKYTKDIPAKYTSRIQRGAVRVNACVHVHMNYD